MNTQEISNLATMLVALATGWLAWVTYQVAKSSNDALQLQSQPYFAFRRISLKLGYIENISALAPAPAIRIELTFWNPGKVMIEYRVEKLSASLNGNDLPAIELASKGGRIFPDQEDTFFYPVSALVSAPSAGSEGEVQAELIYWSTEKQLHRVKLRYKIIITTISPNLTWEWIALTEPEYTQ